MVGYQAVFMLMIHQDVDVLQPCCEHTRHMTVRIGSALAIVVRLCSVLLLWCIITLLTSGLACIVQQFWFGLRGRGYILNTQRRDLSVFCFSSLCTNMA